MYLKLSRSMTNIATTRLRSLARSSIALRFGAQRAAVEKTGERIAQGEHAGALVRALPMRTDLHANFIMMAPADQDQGDVEHQRNGQNGVACRRMWPSIICWRRPRRPKPGEHDNGGYGNGSRKSAL